jgi:hypothetical protein
MRDRQDDGIATWRDVHREGWRFPVDPSWILGDQAPGGEFQRADGADLDDRVRAVGPAIPGSGVEHGGEVGWQCRHGRASYGREIGQASDAGPGRSRVVRVSWKLFRTICADGSAIKTSVAHADQVLLHPPGCSVTTRAHQRHGSP